MKSRSYFKEFLRYVSLNILGMLGLSFYILADTFFISNGLGARGLTALNLAIPIYSIVHGCGLMLGMGGATKYSTYKGSGNRRTADIIFTHTLGMGVVLAVLFALCGLFLSGTITSLLGADREVYPMTHIYLKVILLFAPAFMLNDIFVCFVRNDGNPGLSMAAMLTGSLSNVLLDYIFIFPLQMGIFGAVLATGLAPVISMLVLSRHLVKRRHQFHFIKVKFMPGLAASIVSPGFPSLVTEVSSGIVIIIFNTIILGLLGNVGVAAYGIIANLSLVVMSIYTGIAQGIQPLISRARGAGDNENIRHIMRYAIAVLAGLSAMIYLAVFLFASPIASIFNSENNPQLQAIAITGMKIYFTAVMFAGFNIIISVFFTSTGNSAPAHIASLLRGLIIIVPMAFLLSAAGGITGVWLTFPLTELLVALFLLWQSRVLS